MDFEEANSQVDSLCGALPRDDLLKYLHKVLKVTQSVFFLHYEN